MSDFSSFESNNFGPFEFRNYNFRNFVVRMYNFGLSFENFLKFRNDLKKYSNFESNF